ncbi:MAG: hypothetical protein JWN35_3264 [Frankiales bacterium]|jgi:hypothetical protein|nr:hypothetical protein [Frankiales bacterium]
MIERGVSDRPDGLTPARARLLTAGREELLGYLTGARPDSKCFR